MAGYACADDVSVGGSNTLQAAGGSRSPTVLMRNKQRCQGSEFALLIIFFSIYTRTAHENKKTLDH
jgi:hypothetical protein